MSSEEARLIVLLAGLDTQEAIIAEFRGSDLLYAGLLSDGWSRLYGGTRFIGTIIRGYTSDDVMIERTFGLRALNAIIESKVIAEDFARIVGLLERLRT
jgi:hypothetical protein